MIQKDTQTPAQTTKTIVQTRGMNPTPSPHRQAQQKTNKKYENDQTCCTSN